MGCALLSLWTYGDQIEFATANLHVRRVKQGDGKHPPDPWDEARTLRRLQREDD
jgi:hypothetical protein